MINISVTDPIHILEKRSYLFAFFLGISILTIPLICFGEDSEKDVLKIAVYDSPPFGFMNPDSTFGGLMVEMWEEIARELGWNYEYYQTDMAGLLDGVNHGNFDVGLGSISITAEREQIVDFSQPVNPSETGIGVARSSLKSNFFTYTKPILFSLGSLIGSLIIILLISGTLVWLVERHRNPNHFNRKIHGLGDGLWWAAVTMATVGYGDKVPITKLGRMIAICWMFISIILVSLFTASASSIFTTVRIESQIQNGNDLRRVKVGAAINSSGEEFLIREHISYIKYDNIEIAINEMIAGNIDAVVSNVPVMRYLKHHRYHKQLLISPKYLIKNNMGIALPQDSPLTEELNRVLLEKIAEPKWQKSVYKYLGEE
ncbi:MAG: transporter substrate-binding domain-containing protein [Bacteroidales bacterium]|nr:transporter substrate-binding domain-containing protein [Bacteroidales bacterium]